MNSREDRNIRLESIAFDLGRETVHFVDTVIRQDLIDARAENNETDDLVESKYLIF